MQRNSFSGHFFQKKNLLVREAAFQKALCLYVPVLACLSQHTLLANTGFEEPLAAPPGKTAARKRRFRAWLLHTSPVVLPCLTSRVPPRRKAFINSRVRKQRALQPSSGSLGFNSSKRVDILLVCMHPPRVIETLCPIVQFGRL